MNSSTKLTAAQIRQAHILAEAIEGLYQALDNLQCDVITIKFDSGVKYSIDPSIQIKQDYMRKAIVAQIADYEGLLYDNYNIKLDHPEKN